MNKNIKISTIVIFSVIIIATIIVILVITNSAKEKNSLSQINTVEELSSLLDKVYKSSAIETYNVENNIIDLADEASVKYYTGLDNGEKLEFAIVSEPMINTQAYSLVMAKVKDGVNANEIAKMMSENVNTRKWICVSAEKLYATNSGNIVFLIMSNEKMAKGVYESFKNIVVTVGEEYEKTEEQPSDLAVSVLYTNTEE